MPLAKVLIADIQCLTAKGLEQLINQRNDLQLISRAASREQLFDALTSTNPDLLIFDYNAPGTFHVNDIRQIKELNGQVNILVISGDDNKDNILTSIKLGTLSFLTKNCSEKEILDTIYATAKGDKFYCKKVMDIILEKQFGDLEVKDCEAEKLTGRETEIVRMTVEGMTAKQIAEKLYLSHHTVNTHRKRIMKKLDIKSPTELVIYAINMGIVSNDYSN